MSIKHSYRPCHYRLSFSPCLNNGASPTCHNVSPFACGFLVAAMGHHGDDDDAGFTTVERRGGDSGVAGMVFLCTYVCLHPVAVHARGAGRASLCGARATLALRR